LTKPMMMMMMSVIMTVETAMAWFQSRENDPENILIFKDNEVSVYWCSEGQEKYLQELSITPVGYFTGAIENHSCGCPMGTIFHGENKVFQSNRSDFPMVSFTLNGIWRHMGALFCNWKWIKWFSLFSTPKKI
jgi:hypothetical protein